MGRLSEIAVDLDRVLGNTALDLARERAENARLLAKIHKLECALDQVEEYLEGRVDVVDGSYGEPAPNREMSLMNEINEARGRTPY